MDPLPFELTRDIIRYCQLSFHHYVARFLFVNRLWSATAASWLDSVELYSGETDFPLPPPTSPVWAKYFTNLTSLTSVRLLLGTAPADFELAAHFIRSSPMLTELIYQPPAPRYRSAPNPAIAHPDSNLLQDAMLTCKSLRSLTLVDGPFPGLGSIFFVSTLQTLKLACACQPMYEHDTEWFTSNAEDELDAEANLFRVLIGHITGKCPNLTTLVLARPCPLGPLLFPFLETYPPTRVISPSPIDFTYDTLKSLTNLVELNIGASNFDKEEMPLANDLLPLASNIRNTFPSLDFTRLIYRGWSFVDQFRHAPLPLLRELLPFGVKPPDTFLSQLQLPIDAPSCQAYACLIVATLYIIILFHLF